MEQRGAARTLLLGWRGLAPSTGSDALQVLRALLKDPSPENLDTARWYTETWNIPGGKDAAPHSGDQTITQDEQQILAPLQCRRTKEHSDRCDRIDMDVDPSSVPRRAGARPAG